MAHSNLNTNNAHADLFVYQALNYRNLFSYQEEGIPHLTIARQLHVHCSQRIGIPYAAGKGAAKAVLVQISGKVAR